ncbi:helix-turn-helix domain-containing protein [Mycobacterium sp. SMC-8]|uniref:helix-turn-helix transcriptional regulator n=1 Tax=Mycobacterium sp. SMC-8 TaxID=2857060 RepID=UPI00220E6C5F|nr:helix-turn-helix domain-containing protein [Mycobacterium sp. SMC-8]UXA12393.1 helix-turn-helix domain-containing protein [Mycobacterium sp. SMC-8]
MPENDNAPIFLSPWMTREEVADRLRMKKSTLEAWAVTGYGPRFAKFGKHVRYHIDTVIDWENAQVR